MFIVSLLSFNIKIFSELGLHENSRQLVQLLEDQFVVIQSNEPEYE